MKLDWRLWGSEEITEVTGERRALGRECGLQ
jgi:hypothetical protein